MKDLRCDVVRTDNGFSVFHAIGYRRHESTGVLQRLRVSFHVLGERCVGCPGPRLDVLNDKAFRGDAEHIEKPGIGHAAPEGIKRLDDHG